jgi:hypothetical protein
MNGGVFNSFIPNQIASSSENNQNSNLNLIPNEHNSLSNEVNNKNLAQMNKFPIFNYFDINYFNFLFQSYKNFFLNNQKYVNMIKENKVNESRKNNYFHIGKKKKRNEKLCTECPHTYSPHYAKGMCSNCYHSKGRSKKPWNCSHINKSHYALGLCQNCYQIQYIKKQNIENKIVKDENNINTIKDNNSIKSIKNDEIDGKVHINMEKYYVNKK